jgi:hypothetical protein
MITNEDRASWARIALDAFIARLNMGDEQTEDCVSDLLCDMMHLCDTDGVDWDECLRRALNNYRAEVRDAP